MTPADFLIDTSALARLLLPAQRDNPWLEAARNGLIAIAPLTELELLYGARSRADRDDVQTTLHDAFLPLVVPEGVYDRADQVQAELTDRGEHRGPGPVDLLVAASAELAHLNLVHHDHDFDAIRRVTGQLMTWFDLV